MNYERIYNQIIERAKNRILEGYTERHHIIPRCMGGGNSSNNIVELTAREHFICHKILHFLHPENEKLTYAFIMMCLMKNEKQMRYIPHARQIEYVKLKLSEIRKGKISSEKTLQKIRKSIAIHYQNPENRKKKSDEQLVPEIRMQKREAMIRIWSDPENKRLHKIATMQGMERDGIIDYCRRMGAEVTKTKEWQDKQRAGTVAAMARPEIKAKMCKPRAKASCLNCKQTFGINTMWKHQNKCYK